MQNKKTLFASMRRVLLLRLMALSCLHAIGKEEDCIAHGGNVSVELLFFKMRNHQSQLQIYYNLRVKEREKSFFKKRDIFVERSLKERGDAQYR